MLITRRGLLFLVSQFFLAQQSQHLEQVKSVVKDPNRYPRWVEDTLGALSSEEKIGQMLQIRCYVETSTGNSPGFRATREAIQKYHLGSVILGTHVSASGLLRNTPFEVASTTNDLQTDLKLPLLVAADLERGLASRVDNVPSFPWPMAFGAGGSEEAVERFAAITAKEARAVGIHWILAPVADLNSNPSNPIINDRSFGEDPTVVGNLVAAYIRAARRNRVLVTAKHFPGQGDTDIDSHHGVPSVDGSLRHLDAFELAPFRRAIAAEVDSILVAHVRVPALEPDQNKLATLSRRIVTDLLRNALGFQGVVVTDAMEMKAVSSAYESDSGRVTGRAAVDAINAGCDVIMAPTDMGSVFDSVLNAVKRGDIPQSRVDESVRRILAMKMAMGLNASRFVRLDRVAELTRDPIDCAFAQEISDKTITLVRDNGRVLPLARSNASPPIGPVEQVVTILLSDAFDSSNGPNFESAMMERNPRSKFCHVTNRGSDVDVAQILDIVAGADKIVVAAYVTHRGAAQIRANGKTTPTFGLAGKSGDLLRRVLEVAADKTVVIAFGSPYLIQDFLQIQNYICTYAMASVSEISAAKALFGEIQNQAKLPVTLPGVGGRGESLPWPLQSTIKN